MPFSIADRLTIPKLVVSTSGIGRPEELITLRPLPLDEHGYPIPHPTQISLLLHFEKTNRPSTIMLDVDLDDDAEALEERIRQEQEWMHGAFLGYSLHWQGNADRPLFDLNTYRPLQGEHFPTWYHKATSDLAGFINGTLLFNGEDWRLGSLETRVPNNLGGFCVNEPVSETPLEMAYRLASYQAEKMKQLEFWKTTPWLYVYPRTCYEPCVQLNADVPPLKS